jgi:aminoglycoside/choline kinase family phosphotransferase
LPTSGSNRKYYRLQSNNISLIGVHGESVDENRAFICLARHFLGRGLNVPEVLAVSDDEMFYIQQDLGDTILFDTIKGGRLTGVFSHQEKELLHKTIHPPHCITRAKSSIFSGKGDRPEIILKFSLFPVNSFSFFGIFTLPISSQLV